MITRPRSQRYRGKRLLVLGFAVLALVGVLTTRVFVLQRNGKSALISAKTPVADAQAIASSQIVLGMSVQQAIEKGTTLGFDMASSVTEAGLLRGILREPTSISNIVSRSLLLKVNFVDGQVVGVECTEAFTGL